MAAVGVSAPVLAASLGSAFCFAASSVSKHISAGHGPHAPGPRPSAVGKFVLATVRHPLWLAGIAADSFGVALQVVALHLGALAIVQPIMLTGLVFAILLRGALSRTILRRQLFWAVVVTGGLAAIVDITRSGSSDAATWTVDRLPAIVSAGIGLLFVGAAVTLGGRTPRLVLRATLMGVAAGTLYAGTAALIKAVSNIAVRDPWALPTSWQTYCLVALGASGLIISQIGFQAGALAVGLPVASMIDPLLSIVIGVAVFDEHVLLGPGHGVLLLVLVVVLVLAVVRLAVLGDRPTAARSDLRAA